MSIPVKVIRAEFGKLHTPHTWNKNPDEYHIFLDGVRFVEKLLKNMEDDMEGMRVYDDHYDKPRIP